MNLKTKTTIEKHCPICKWHDDGICTFNIKFRATSDGTVFCDYFETELIDDCLQFLCVHCGNTGIVGIYEHVDQFTGEHLGDEDIECVYCREDNILSDVDPERF